MSAGMDCWQRNHLCVPHRSLCGFLSADAATSAMEEMATARNTDSQPHRTAEYEQCLRTRCKVYCRAARDGQAAEVDHQ